MATNESPEHVVIWGVKPKIRYRGFLRDNEESNCEEDRKKYTTFLGIRYAKPPIQENLFQVPILIYVLII